MCRFVEKFVYSKVGAESAFIAWPPKPFPLRNNYKVAESQITTQMSASKAQVGGSPVPDGTKDKEGTLAVLGCGAYVFAQSLLQFM